MGMTAELEVDACLLRLLQMIGLMVEQNRKPFHSLGKLLHGGTLSCHAVVTAYHIHALEMSDAVLQQLDARLLKKRSACATLLKNS